MGPPIEKPGTCPPLDRPRTVGQGAFAARLRTWRRINGIKQATLAEMVGVSQTVVSLWENGHDIPSPERLARLETIMADTARDELAVERLFVERQGGIRALFDVDGVRLLAVSRGFRDLWPKTGDLKGSFLIDYLVNEARRLASDEKYAQAILSGELVLASGHSHRMTNLDIDEMVPHRWHMCFRRFGPRTIVDVVYEPSEGACGPGIDDLVYLDDLKPE
ncbi:helix-turn-helix transcriptional regulator [Aquabacter sp. L1I39]|uniref:helix-turn-helix domain-containing protein n=1 Tax=Aquabacter sp. L1I39 TaxID=2820278 RepID=UPI001ADA97F7|nr:helix-turn-helix transcriptional regulator [Aquabacter sp. L1I39]QTL02181.1 helix-turn-helix transcriptional regulator [Aquabacter sp. L1I39]